MFISWIYIKFQKTGSGNRNPRWRRRPSWIYINGYNSGKYWRNLTKFETQVEDIMPKRKYAKPEVLDKNPRWPPPPSCFHVFSCRFVIFYPICIKFCRKIHLMLLHTGKQKNRKWKPKKQDGGVRHVGFTQIAITQPNINRFWWNFKHTFQCTTCYCQKQTWCATWTSIWPPPPS